MHRSKRAIPAKCGPDNCFGFEDDDPDVSLWSNSSIMNDTTAPTQFQTNKPYRLALYVRPIQHRRLYKTNTSVILKSTVEKQSNLMVGLKDDNFNTAEKSEVKKTKRKEMKPKKVMLFDENVKPENPTKKYKQTTIIPFVEKEKTITETPSTRKNVLKEVNTKPVTKTKQNKTRRSYERKCKKTETEFVIEPSSEQIIREIEIKKLNKTKLKKTAKEEQEFEKWANSVNSDFNDVDKFELSIAYD